jgi:hypothetical protein
MTIGHANMDVDMGMSMGIGEGEGIVKGMGTRTLIQMDNYNRHFTKS